MLTIGFLYTTAAGESHAFEGSQSTHDADKCGGEVEPPEVEEALILFCTPVGSAVIDDMAGNADSCGRGQTGIFSISPCISLCGGGGQDAGVCTGAGAGADTGVVAAGAGASAGAGAGGAGAGADASASAAPSAGAEDCHLSLSWLYSAKMLAFCCGCSTSGLLD